MNNSRILTTKNTKFSGYFFMWIWICREIFKSALEYLWDLNRPWKKSNTKLKLKFTFSTNTNSIKIKSHRFFANKTRRNFFKAISMKLTKNKMRWRTNMTLGYLETKNEVIFTSHNKRCSVKKAFLIQRKTPVPESPF